MTDIAEPLAPATTAPPRSRAGRLLALLLPAAGLIAGAASTYAGWWSPLSLITRDGPAAVPVPAVTFVDVPRIVLTVPGERRQTLSMTVMIEVAPEAAAEARLLMPRIIDSYNGFLSRIDAAAFSRRGILEIVRGELVTRTRFILGEAAIRDLLITEFRIQ